MDQNNESMNAENDDESLSQDIEQALARYDDGDRTVQVMAPGAVAALAKSEVEAQLDAAHRHQRSISRFLKESLTLVSKNKDVAAACIYTLPRDGKKIAGPSVRLAEIAASAYGNLHVAARVVEVTDTEVVAQGAAWDLEKNLRVTTETRRRITGKTGRRFSDDMVIVTGNAAASIALRNAIFRVIPKAYIDEVYKTAVRVAAGSAQQLDKTRADWIKYLGDKGVAKERVLAALGRKGVEEIGLEDMEILIGLVNRLRSGDATAEEVFPHVTAAPVPGATAPEGQRMSLKGKDAKPAAEKAKAEERPATTTDKAQKAEPPEPGSDL